MGNFLLKNTNRQTPGGMWFYEPRLKLRVNRYSSFHTIVDSVIQARLANPSITQQFKLATDRASVEREVSEFNAEDCRARGYEDYITPLAREGKKEAFFPQPPNPVRRPPRLQGGVAQVAQAVAVGKVMVDFVTKEEAVGQDHAEKRAAICAKCPRNLKANLLDWFTVAAATAIRATYELKTGMGLKTSNDDNLGLCEACGGCPMGLKVWIPIAKIWPHLTAEDKDWLDASCWIPPEATAAELP